MLKEPAWYVEDIVPLYISLTMIFRHCISVFLSLLLTKIYCAKDNTLSFMDNRACIKLLPLALSFAALLILHDFITVGEEEEGKKIRVADSQKG